MSARSSEIIVPIFLIVTLVGSYVFGTPLVNDEHYKGVRVQVSSQ